MRPNLKKIAWSALIGAVSSEFLLILIVLLIFPFIFKFAFKENKSLIFAFAFFIVGYVIYAPVSFVNFILETIKGEAYNKISGIDDLIWHYRPSGHLEVFIFWLFLGAIIGIAILSWAKKPLRRFLRITITLISLIILIGGIILIERIPGIKRKHLQPLPPVEYSGPCFSLPKNLKVEEIPYNVYQKIMKYNSTVKLFQKSDTSNKNNNQNVQGFINQQVGNTTYRIYTYHVDGNLWPYALLKKNKSDSDWKVLGPFLPGLGVDGFPAFELTANQIFIENDCVRWIVREGNSEYGLAHKRPIKDKGRIWKCSFPLIAYSNDSDRDHLTDMEEAALLTDPNNPDTDGDGIEDGFDSSPHGWYRESQGRFGMYRDMLSTARPKKDKGQSITFLDNIIILESLDLRPHVEGKIVLLTLNKNEEKIFRNRIGLGKYWDILNVRLNSHEVFLFGMFGLLSVDCISQGLSGRGYLVFCFRFPKGRWKFIFSTITWIS